MESSPNCDRLGQASASTAHLCSRYTIPCLPWAAIATLLATARLNNVNPHAWLARILERIANGWPNSRIEELMPWAFKA